MKKIVRLTESDLVRLVNRVINEQSSQVESQIAKEFWNACQGIGTNEDNMISAIKKITSVQQFNKVNEIVKSLPSKMSIPEWINDEMDESGIGGSRDWSNLKSITLHLNKIGVKCRFCGWERNFYPRTFALGNSPCTKGSAWTGLQPTYYS